uniref:Uncharacterized protein n=1 Tax=Anopheles farauti TaxID=69004 RepID=A0A182Q6U3_9DIPT
MTEVKLLQSMAEIAITGVDYLMRDEHVREALEVTLNHAHALQLCWQEEQAAANVNANPASAAAIQEARLAVQQQQQERRDHRNRLRNLRVRARAEEARLTRVEDRATRRLADNIAEAERVADAALLAEALRFGEPRRRPVRPRTEARTPQASPLQTPREEGTADQNIGRRRRGDPLSAEGLVRRHQYWLRMQREWRARVQAGTRPPLLPGRQRRTRLLPSAEEVERRRVRRRDMERERRHRTSAVAQDEPSPMTANAVAAVMAAATSGR